jgi:hypothetical protein
MKLTGAAILVSRGTKVLQAAPAAYPCRSPLSRAEGQAAVPEFQPGDRVFWWKRITRAVEYPYRAEVVSVGAKRITVTVEDPDDANDRLLRHVATESLQPVAGYYEKAIEQEPAMLEPVASWGRFTRYLEIGEDLRAVRQVDVFEDGHMLCYDRVHWVDDFGMLGDAKINRNRKEGPWGKSEEIEPAEFERIWMAARSSPTWLQQVATAQMGHKGSEPVWFTIQGWRPGRTSG